VEGWDQKRGAVGSCARGGMQDTGACDFVAAATGPHGQGKGPPLQQQQWGGRGEHDVPVSDVVWWVSGEVG
jgi:hypothetical protein